MAIRAVQMYWQKESLLMAFTQCFCSIVYHDRLSGIKIIIVMLVITENIFYILPVLINLFNMSQQLLLAKS